MERYHVVAVKPGNEAAVVDSLTDKGFFVDMLPKKHTRRNNRTKAKYSVVVPMFPGYVFSRVKGDLLPPLRSVTGVVGFVRCSKLDDPATVTEEILAPLRSAVLADVKTKRTPIVGETLLVDVLGHGLHMVVSSIVDEIVTLSAGHFKKTARIQDLIAAEAA